MSGTEANTLPPHISGSTRSTPGRLTRKPCPRRYGSLTWQPSHGVYLAHEHCCPQNPSVVAHLVKVAGAISFLQSLEAVIAVRRPFSFVLCGVPSASFVRGSHEQDGFLTAGPQRIPHPRRPRGHAVGGAILWRRQPAR